MAKRLCCFVAFFTSLTVLAMESENRLMLSPEIQRGNIYEPKGLWPMIGAGLGRMGSSDNTRTGGVPTHIKALGSYYFDTMPWVADFGLGLHNQFLTQRGSGSDTIQSLYTEFAGRYQFSNRWQLGAIWNTLVDTPDRYESNTNGLASSFGAQAMKEFTWKDEYLVRVGGRAVTSVGLSGGSVNTLMAELEVSFGSGNSGGAGLVQEAVEPTPAPVAIAPHLDAQAIKTYDLDPKLVHFATDSTKLVKSSDKYFSRLARALANNHQLFEKVEVIGHTDQRGTDAYNNKLSVRRAQEISGKLVAAGVKSKQIETEGMGKTQLLTTLRTPASLQLNRRVQLQFVGVKNQEALQNIINSVQ